VTREQIREMYDAIAAAMNVLEEEGEGIEFGSDGILRGETCKLFFDHEEEKWRVSAT
jgi:hypothetical protein